MSQSTNDQTGPDTITDEDIREYRLIRPLIGLCLNLNHDLNNPLAGVLGYAEFMKMDSHQLTNDQNAHLDQILKCAERMKNMIDDLCEAKMKLAKEIDIEKLSAKYSE